MLNSRKFFSTLLFAIFAVGCMPVATPPIDEVPATMEPTEEESIVNAQSSTVTETPLPTPTLIPASTETASAPLLSVRITAINGNLNIRRGPGTAYDRIGILKSASSANVIGQDVLSKWVQIQIPATEQTGWVSLQTPYSRIDGNLEDIPDFTFTEWPEPAYIKNCTEHDIIILPNEIYLYSLWTNADYLNYVQVDPGVYELQDATLPDAPVYETIDIQEGETFYITVNGLDEYHKCPENN
ncbi:MAG: SH3 domain-containing protein [Anaerolineae bacterium]